MKIMISLITGLLCAAPVSAQHDHHAAPARTSGADSARLETQLTAARRATERYLDHENAVADGYKKFGADGPLMGEHWYHPERVKQALDLAQPATLQYAVISGKRTLVGVAYNLYQGPDDPLPEGFAGGADEWHVHDMPKLARALVADRPFLRWVVNRRIERGKVGAGRDRTHLVMVHAWIWSDNPDGMFAQQQRALPYLRAALPANWAIGADADAAWGTALLSGGCALELDRLERLARLSDQQSKTLGTACSRATERVSAARRSGAAESFNRSASEAWRDFTILRDRSLTADQKTRLGSVIEPMMSHH